MSFRADGTIRCDKCNVDVGNGGIDRCVIVSRLDPKNLGSIEQLHFCIDREEEGATVQGCSDRVFNARHLGAYNTAQEATS
jgi:hypothetical protein